MADVSQKQLQIIMLRSPLLAAIRNPDPVIFMEPKILYHSAIEQVPIDDFELP